MPQNTFPLPPAASNSRFTFLGMQDLKISKPDAWKTDETVTYALNNPNDGVYVIDGQITQTTKDVAAATTAAGKPFILGYTDLGLRTGVPGNADMDTLAEALKLTDKIAIGTSPQSEWSPLPGRPQRYGPTSGPGTGSPGYARLSMYVCSPTSPRAAHATAWLKGTRPSFA